MSNDLFEPGNAPLQGEGDPPRPSHAPLAERLRPLTFDEFLGQRSLLGAGSPLRCLIEEGRVPSMIFWGPPGCGKTTLALLIARHTKSQVALLSAVTAQLAEVRRVLEQARMNLRRDRRTILFVDEIHRFNKAQQDAFLPAVEAGVITLIGATTENPSFSVISPLLSRCRVVTLKALGESDLVALLSRALEDRERGLGAAGVEVGEESLAGMVALSDGDARRALNLLELSVEAARAQGKREVDPGSLRELAQRHFHYDKSGEEHYNLISAFHKSLRSSDPQAALYWMARMLISGEEPLYVARRMVRFASEDIGLADPQALVQALAACQSYQMLGSPEGELALVQAAIYLATAPKSNSLYKAEKAVRSEIEATGSLPAPLALRNAPTSLMKSIGYGEGYTYDHDAPGHFSPKQCLPENLKNGVFYEPGPFGFERDIRKRLDWWDARRREALEAPKND